MPKAGRQSGGGGQCGGARFPPADRQVAGVSPRNAAHTHRQECSSPPHTIRRGDWQRNVLKSATDTNEPSGQFAVNSHLHRKYHGECGLSVDRCQKFQEAASTCSGGLRKRCGDGGSPVSLLNHFNHAATDASAGGA